jgi:AraC-like DNA-binding protein
MPVNPGKIGIWKRRAVPATALSAQLLLPNPPLAGCVFAAVVRDTRDRHLTEAQRVNRFPASPLCSISWFIEGCSYLGEPGREPGLARQEPLPEVMFSGPQTRPLVSWNPGPVLAITLTFYPEAWAALSGVQVGAFVDQNVPIEAVVSGKLLGLCREVLGSSGTCVERIRRLEARLERIWRESRPPGHKVMHWLEDWSFALAARAATSGVGTSVRQIERRIKAWAGQSHRALGIHGRIERLFAKAMAARAIGGSDLAKLAAESGYADQSHMGRDVRRITGVTPSKLGELIENDETFWCYRLLGERFE